MEFLNDIWQNTTGSEINQGLVEKYSEAKKKKKKFI